MSVVCTRAFFLICPQLFDAHKYHQRLRPGSRYRADLHKGAAGTTSRRDQCYVRVSDQRPVKKMLLLPDIDKQEKWSLSIDSLVKTVDFAFIDATFYSSAELPGRNMSEIPHPLVEETIECAKKWSIEIRQKIILTHFNHTNPLLDDDNVFSRSILSLGLRVARVGDRFLL